MIRLSVPLLVLLSFLSAGPVAAAQKWGIDGEMTAQFEAKVVDLLCELNGDCPAGCGAGKRQLGLLRDDGRLLIAVKSNTLFAGATLDLLPYCGERVEVDGLIITHPAMVIYMLQKHRRPGDADWVQATSFAKDWKKRNGSPDAKRWFRRDPAVKDVIGEFGKVGRPDLVPPPAE
ncbi:hypothetical protein NUH88_20385 [Nisaea acidiphila]|uniref:Uncharacterized protein n=1 Tax=Nisaea acidiphila TaxID=1862145 RepID=A0A9J7AR72_9PROT|nr:hypothetical protein [Nisaea acidiphila]UUX49743.1 hypothetical protein NUH88_20385 [Nisaea acidiphila]